MTPPPDLFALWLLPAPAEREHFASVIRELAAPLGAPIFEPHLTLRGAISTRAEALQLLAKLPRAERFEFQIEGIHFSERYTQTLFVRFHLDDELRRLREAVGAESEFDPHISLLYQEMPLAAKAELARGIVLPFTHVRFAGWKVIAHPPQITKRAEVEAWREIASG